MTDYWIVGPRGRHKFIGTDLVAALRFLGACRRRFRFTTFRLGATTSPELEEA